MATETETTPPDSEVIAPAPTDLETSRRGRRVPAFDALQRPRIELRHFVAGVMVAAAAVVLSVLAFNIVVDPFGTFGTGIFPTAIESDRSTKITLLEDLPYNPDILIMGSSRSRPARPKLLQQLTGRTGFNSGVTGGSPPDWWVFSHLWLKRFPKGPHHVLLFVSDGIGPNTVKPQLAADPRAAPYLPKGDKVGGWSFVHKVEAYMSLDAARDSYRVVRACFRPAGCSTDFFHRDGSLKQGLLHSAGVRSKRLKEKLAERLQKMRREGIGRRIPGPGQMETFERLLGYLNDHGIRPVIVKNPEHPAMLAELTRQGNPRYKWTLKYLAGLHSKYDFDFIDLTSIDTFGGSPLDFADPTHVDTANMDRMLRYIVTHDNGNL